jgi:hypothetical protein
MGSLGSSFVKCCIASKTFKNGDGFCLLSVAARIAPALAQGQQDDL